MRTSTFKLTTSQQVIFAVVFTLAILFAGCNDTVNSDGGGGGAGIAPAPSLEGNWLDIESVHQAGNTITHALSFDGTRGIYQVTESPNSKECGDYPNLTKVFNYEKAGDNTLQLEVIHHTVCGEDQEKSEETVRYVLLNDNLQIFNKTFIRDN